MMGSQSESEHASQIDEHARLILWQTGPICVLNTGLAPVARLHDNQIVEQRINSEV